MAVGLKSNVYVGPVNIFPNFLPCLDDMLKLVSRNTIKIYSAYWAWPDSDTTE